MLMAQYDYEEDVKAQREESFEMGFELGREQGHELGLEQGLEQGLSALIQSPKEVLPSLDQIYEIILKNDIYKDVSIELVRSNYNKD